MNKRTWLPVLTLSLLLAACNTSVERSTPEANVDLAKQARYEGHITFDDGEKSRALSQMELDFIAQGLKDNNEADDAYLQLAQAFGGFTGLRNFVTTHASEPDLLEKTYAQYGVNLTVDGGKVKSQNIYACDQYFPASDRNRNFFLLKNLMYTYIDSAGRPGSASKVFPPLGLADRDETCQRTVGNLFTGISQPNYQGGHLIADGLGGYGGRANLAPQWGNFNTGIWRVAEQKIKTCRNLGFLSVDMNTLLTYPNSVDIIPDTWKMYGIINNSRVRPTRTLAFSALFANGQRGGTGGPEVLNRFRNDLDLVGCGRRGIALVVDDTGSMSSVISAVQSSLTSYINSEPEEDDVQTSYSLTTFKDNVTPQGNTTNRGQIISQVGSLYADGGDDCPENSIGGLNAGIRSFDSLEFFQNAPKDVVLVTDASAQNGDVSGAIAAANANGTRVNVLLTGDCDFSPVGALKTASLSAQELSSQTIFKRIAEETGGRFYNIPGGTTGDFTLVLNDIFANIETSTPQDIEPPIVTVISDRSSIWPPNHKMVKIGLHVTAKDNIDASPLIELVGVAISEPEDGQGSGNTAQDVQITAKGEVYVRAERSGRGNGRIYTITYRATDTNGNVGYGNVKVKVPKSRGAN